MQPAVSLNNLQNTVHGYTIRNRKLVIRNEYLSERLWGGGGCDKLDLLRGNGIQLARRQMERADDGRSEQIYIPQRGAKQC